LPRTDVAGLHYGPLSTPRRTPYLLLVVGWPVTVTLHCLPFPTCHCPTDYGWLTRIYLTVTGPLPYGPHYRLLHYSYYPYPSLTIPAFPTPPHLVDPHIDCSIDPGCWDPIHAVPFIYRLYVEYICSDIIVTFTFRLLLCPHICCPITCWTYIPTYHRTHRTYVIERDPIITLLDPIDYITLLFTLYWHTHITFPIIYTLHISSHTGLFDYVPHRCSCTTIYFDTVTTHYGLFYITILHLHICTTHITLPTFTFLLPLHCHPSPRFPTDPWDHSPIPFIPYYSPFLGYYPPHPLLLLFCSSMHLVRLHAVVALCWTWPLPVGTWPHYWLFPITFSYCVPGPPGPTFLVTPVGTYIYCGPIPHLGPQAGLTCPHPLPGPLHTPTFYSGTWVLPLLHSPVLHTRWLFYDLLLPPSYIYIYLHLPLFYTIIPRTTDPVDCSYHVTWPIRPGPHIAIYRLHLWDGPTDVVILGPTQPFPRKDTFTLRYTTFTCRPCWLFPLLFIPVDPFGPAYIDTLWVPACYSPAWQIVVIYPFPTYTTPDCSCAHIWQTRELWLLRTLTGHYGSVTPTVPHCEPGTGKQPDITWTIPGWPLLRTLRSGPAFTVIGPVYYYCTGPDPGPTDGYSLWYITYIVLFPILLWTSPLPDLFTFPIADWTGYPGYTHLPTGHYYVPDYTLPHTFTYALHCYIWFWCPFHDTTFLHGLPTLFGLLPIYFPTTFPVPHGDWFGHYDTHTLFCSYIVGYDTLPSTTLFTHCRPVTPLVICLRHLTTHTVHVVITTCHLFVLTQSPPFPYLLFSPLRYRCSHHICCWFTFTHIYVTAYRPIYLFTYTLHTAPTPHYRDMNWTNILWRKLRHLGARATYQVRAYYARAALSAPFHAEWQIDSMNVRQ